MKAALWFARHHAVAVEIWDDETEAAEVAHSMREYEQGVPIGVQLEDGTLHAAEDWAELRRVTEERRAADERAEAERKARPPLAIRKVRCPFGKPDEARVLADTPEWVGKP